MTKQEHLLVILSEECAELSKEASKALRFGLNDHEPEKTETNAQRIVAEFNDLFAIIGMLKDINCLDEKELVNIKAIQAKQKKVEKWFKYSQSVGTLS